MYLNCHSYHSLRYGTLSPEELARGAFASDVDTLVLTDINNTSAIPEFYFTCRKSGVKPLAGVDIRDKNNKQICVLIAGNNTGLMEINRFLSTCNARNKNYTDVPDFNNVYKIIPFENFSGQKLSDNEFIGVRPKQANSLLSFKYSPYYSRCVLLHTVSFLNSGYYELHRHLRAIDKNILLSQLPAELYSSPYDTFVHPSQFRKIFSLYPELIKNSLELLGSCSLYFDKSPKNLRAFTGNISDDIILLRRNSLEGMKKRYGRDDPEALSRLKKELQIIEKMGFVSYFLIAWDIVKYAKHRDFFHVGRGSGANSIVSYCLGITDVDPIELNLYFERFLNPKRSSPPDFDIDFSWRDRDVVLDYIFKKYGKERTCLLGALSTFKTRSVLRETAKVYGLPKSEIDLLVKNPHRAKDRDPIHAQILAFAAKMDSFPNLRTIHAGGVLISDKPLYYYTATDMPPKGMPTSQWDMYVAEDLGFEKFDILSQRGLGHIRDCINIIKENHNVEVDITRTEKFKTDPEINKLLASGETMGCFYIESPAMRGLINKLKCSDYKTLVAASSIIRPGVAKSGMMKEYIKRFNAPDSFEFLHPVLKKHLSETYGIMVYQEDVLKVCHYYAGMDFADADLLRRAMSGKFRSKKEFLNIRDKFFDLCNQKKRPIQISAELWRQIESFAGYSFSKAHSASYAVESYQSLFLKTYFPLEFITAVINNFGGFYSPAVYFQEAKRLGAKLMLPCVNNSNYLNRLIDRSIFIGFVHIKDLEKKIAEAVTNERARNGSFYDLNDFVNRLSPCREQLNILIKAGAFSFTGNSVPELLWKACIEKTKPKAVVYAVQQKLFHVKEQEHELPELKISKIRQAYNEIDLLEFPVSMSFFDMLKTKFRGEVKASVMLKFKNKTVRMLGLFVCLKYVKLDNGNYMNFCTWTDADGNFFDSVHFPDSLKNYPLRGFGVYLMLGRIDTDFDYPVMRVEKLAKMHFSECD